MHSISIERDSHNRKMDIDLPLDENNKVPVIFGEYGWSGPTLTKQFDKLCYLVTMVAAVELKYFPIDTTKTGKQLFVETEGFKMIDAFVRTQPGCNGLSLDLLTLNLEDADWKNPPLKYVDIGEGYIDHQSGIDQYKSLQMFFDKNNITLEEVVTDGDVWILIQNDNCRYDD